MKKYFNLFLTVLAVALVVGCAFSFASCGKDKTVKHTVTYYGVEKTKDAKPDDAAEDWKQTYTYTAEVVGTETVEDGKAIQGYAQAADGTVYFASEYFTVKEYDAEGTEAYDISTPVKADLTLYAGKTEYAVIQNLATGTGYTLNYAISEFPSTWNSHIYTTDTDSTILGYCSSGLYTFDYNEDKTGFKWVNDMAASDPVDVTSQYVGEKWGIEDGETWRAVEITLRDDLCWDDGTPITSEDFIESTKRLLNPLAINSRADDYTYSGNFIMVNAKNYLYAGSTIYESCAPDGIGSGDYTGWKVGEHSGGFDEDYPALAIAVPEDIQKNIYFNLGEESYVGGWLAANYGSYFESYGGPAGVLVDGLDGTGAITVEGVEALQDKTLYEILQDEDLSATLDYLFYDFWCTDADEEFGYFCYHATMPEMDFADVGIQATAPNKIVYIMENSLEGFYLKYAISGTWLVKTDVYDACDNLNATMDAFENGDTAYKTTYCTTVATTPSYGPYKLTAYQQDKYFSLEKNAKWWAYADDENKGLYQTTNIVYTKCDSASTRLQMFLSGLFDSYGLQADDMADYSTSDRTYYTDGDSTWFIAFNPDLEAYQDAEAEAHEKGKEIDKEVLTVKEFRQALSYALNRADYELVCDPTGNVAKALFSPMIISDPDNGTTYRSTPEAKNAIVEFWGLANDIGEGKLYADIDKAIESITGYNLAMAKNLFNQAYDIADEAGYFDNHGDTVEILIGTPNLTSGYYNKGYDYLCNAWKEAVKGTKFENKLTFSRDGTLGNSFGDILRANGVDMLFGVGFTGSALNPYGLVEVFTTSSIKYDEDWDTSKVSAVVAIPQNIVEGASAPETDAYYQASLDAWTYGLGGRGITVTKVEKDAQGEWVAVKDGDDAVTFANVKFDTTIDYAIRGRILAAIEQRVLNQYDLLPIAYDSSASMLGFKVEYYTQEYVYGVGRGGLKYMKFNYNDAEWANFVKSQGGILDYKASDAE